MIECFEWFEVLEKGGSGVRNIGGVLVFLFF